MRTREFAPEINWPLGWEKSRKCIISRPLGYVIGKNVVLFSVCKTMIFINSHFLNSDIKIFFHLSMYNKIPWFNLISRIWSQKNYNMISYSCNRRVIFCLTVEVFNAKCWLIDKSSYKRKIDGATFNGNFGKR